MLPIVYKQEEMASIEAPRSLTNGIWAVDCDFFQFPGHFLSSVGEYHFLELNSRQE